MSAITISVSSFAIILLAGNAFVDVKSIIFFAAINSSFFALGSIVKIQSLKFIPTSFAFPITKLNAVFLIIYALVLFNEKPQWNQWIGIIISLSILAFISLSVKNKYNTKNQNKQQIAGVLLALLAAFSTSISMLTGKYASTEVSKIHYIFVSYTLVMIYTTIINRTIYRKKRKLEKSMNKKIFLFGAIIGILNFTGYYMVLNAFETGPLSLIQGISSNSFIIPIILSIFIFREKFTYKNALVVLLSVISILLIKLEF
jgi:drug/metabolite transporter (DMT)-like permease